MLLSLTQHYFLWLPKKESDPEGWHMSCAWAAFFGPDGNDRKPFAIELEEMTVKEALEIKRGNEFLNIELVPEEKLPHPQTKLLPKLQLIPKCIHYHPCQLLMSLLRLSPELVVTNILPRI